VAGIRTSRPHMAKFGVVPVTEWVVIRYADIKAGKKEGQLFALSDAVVRSICRSVLFIRSVWPSDRG